MNINVEALDFLPKIYEMINIVNEKLENKIEKRWLSTEEAGIYLGYSKDSIDAMVKKSEFISGIHYHQKARKRMFDKELLDKWVVGLDMLNNNYEAQINSTIEDIVSSIAA